MMAGAGEMLAAWAVAALGRIDGLNGAYDGVPERASLPYAAIEIGPEADWSWKSGAGREIRLTATVHDGGERPARLRALMEAVEAALLGLEGADGWRVVNAVLARRRTAQKRTGAWSGMVEMRVRMEAEN
ncbi:MAG: DUF3168 domain-containing protein [Sphingomonas sp.]